jgi:DNA-binding transcriptional ArsR family regulator
LPPADTPREAGSFSPRHDGLAHALEPAQSAAAAWRCVTVALAGTQHIRLSFAGQRARSTSPVGDTPRDAGTNLSRRGGYPYAPESAETAALAWRTVTAVLAGTPHVRLSFDGGRTYPARHARRLPGEPPESHPCVVPVYDAGAASGRMLVLDLDPGRAVGLEDQAAALGQLLERLGARYVADIAPSRGRHLYVLFSSPLPWRELRDLCRAMALRFPAIDANPMCSLSGQISPPGSRHKSGGWRTLTTPLSEAREAVEHPNGPEVWNGLLVEFAAELQQVESDVTVADLRQSPSAELDDTGVPWVPRLGGRAPLGAELDRVARTGRCPGRGRSEARMAILCAAAARGWRLTDAQEAVRSGRWKGFPGLYERPSEPSRMDRLLVPEWRKAIAFVTGSENVRTWLTSDSNHAPPPLIDGADPFGLIRQWVTGTDCAAVDPDRVRGWGLRAVAVRQLLAAIAQACMVSGSTVIEFGTRNLSLHAGLSQRTVSRLLVMLRNEPDPLLDLVSRRQAVRADRYQIRIPDRYAESVRWRRRRVGRIDGVHAAFMVLGGPAFLVHQVLAAAEARGAEVARAARLSASATSAALKVLAEHGLVERGRGGWRRGDASLDEVATSTGAADLHRERAERYKRDRESWRARLRQYASARSAMVAPGDGWLGLDDEDDWETILFSRWPVLSDDFVRGPPEVPAGRRDPA